MDVAGAMLRGMGSGRMSPFMPALAGKPAMEQRQASLETTMAPSTPHAGAALLTAPENRLRPGMNSMNCLGQLMRDMPQSLVPPPLKIRNRPQRTAGTRTMRQATTARPTAMSPGAPSCSGSRV